MDKTTFIKVGIIVGAALCILNAKDILTGLAIAENNRTYGDHWKAW